MLGSNVAEQLFQNRDPVGEYVRVNARRYRVIGLLESQGGGGFGTFDTQVLIPITTAYYRLSSERTATGDVTSQPHQRPGPGRGRHRPKHRGDERRASPTPPHHRGGRLHRHQPAEHHRNAGRDDEHPGCVPWRHYRGHIAARRRHRDHEYHAGVGDRANTRDRHSKGHGRKAARHPPSSSWPRRPR